MILTMWECGDVVANYAERIILMIWISIEYDDVVANYAELSRMQFDDFNDVGMWRRSCKLRRTVNFNDLGMWRRSCKPLPSS